jgi:hypothetical protein
MLRRAVAVLFLTTSQAPGQTARDDTILQRHAASFAGKIRLLVAEETLLQRSYTLPPHSHFAVGAAAAPVYAQYFTREIVSQYAVASLKGDPAGNLLELREIVSRDGVAVQTPAAAQKALSMSFDSGEERIRKRLLATFTDLGLVDVATDFSLLLLIFARPGLRGVELHPAGSGWIGTDETSVLDWRQTEGGALEFRGRKTARRPMSGRIWLRQSDGTPLRLSSSFEHDEARHHLRDDATVDYTPSRFGCVTPASVVHRHVVDDKVLTENLYTYGPFRQFSSESTIRYADPSSPGKK